MTTPVQPHTPVEHPETYASAAAAVAEAAAMRPEPDPLRGVGSTETTLPSGPAVDTASWLANAERSQARFGDVLAQRRSERSYAAVALGDLAMLLNDVFALQGTAPADDGGVRRFRPTPSAGARSPLTPLVLADDVPGLMPGLWRYDPDGTRLFLVADASSEANSAVERAWSLQCEAGQFASRPPVIVVLAARFDATLARYPGGTALVWRDCGAALATLHLTATSMGMASCILGTAATLSPNLLEACALDQSLVTDVGALALGRRVTK